MAGDDETLEDRIVNPWRDEFEIPEDVAFFNHAAFGPVTRRGRRSVETLMDRWGRFADGPDVDEETYRLLSEARDLFAQIIGARHDRVAFAPNTSFGINAVLWGLPLRSGERILVADSEFPAAVYVVQNVAARRGLKIGTMPTTGGYVAMEDFEAALRGGAAVLVLSWVQFFNGYRYDLQEVTDLCHRHGCFVLIDATQGAGAIPLDVASSGIDALACGGQKWLFGQPGSGFFYIAPEPVRPVTPPFAGWLGVDWGYEFYDLRRWDRPPYPDGRQWEVGTYPYFATRFVREGLGLIHDCGIQAVWRTICGVHERVVGGLSRSRFVPLVFPAACNRSGILVLQGGDTRELHRHLTKRKVFTALREGNIRLSPHFHTADADADHLLYTIEEFERTS